jgi:hypothetical protein
MNVQRIGFACGALFVGSIALSAIHPWETRAPALNPRLSSFKVFSKRSVGIAIRRTHITRQTPD